MRLIVDTEERTLVQETRSERRVLDLYGPEAFEALSAAWLELGWNQKYTYTFTWMGRPIIQLPEDLVRAQEVIYRLRPDVIVETGIAHGGSLIYFASLCKLLGHGRVIGVDIEIRPHNRQALEAHELFPYLTLVEGPSTEPAVVKRVHSLVRPGESAIVFLDSDHSKRHVLEELRAYHDLVTPGSYIVATDGIMQDVARVPRGKREWLDDNPQIAVAEFVREHPEFAIEQPAWPFNESALSKNVTHWPGAWLRLSGA